MKRTMFAAFLGTTALVPLSAMAQQNPAPQPNVNQQTQQQRQSAQQNQGQQTQAAQQNQGPSASQVRNQAVFSQSGRELGRINSLVQGQDNQAYAIVAAGDRQVLVPVSRIAFENNRFTISGADDQLRFPAYNQQVAGQYREVDPNFRLAIVGYDVDPIVAARRTADGSNIVVQQPAPTVRVDQASPQVTVQQAQPTVTVRQAQPEILVRQPQPTVTVDIPQPEIIVRMPQPDVNVAMAQPDVRVLMQRPEVSVQRAGQPQVQVQRGQPEVIMQRQAGAEANVQVQRVEGQPQVRYERAEPRVVINQAQGQPNVRVERVQGATNQVEPRRDPIDTAAEGRAGAGLNFATFDRDRNRMLAREEFNPFATRVYGGWDANRNRRLERDEFYGGMYGVWDFDRDNRLTEAEYDRAWGTWGRGLDRVEFGRFDRNRDGFLDREEFAGGWGDNGLFERWDADRGGWLADNEFGNGLFGVWGGERNQIAENDFTPWLGTNWGVDRTATATAVEPRRDAVGTAVEPNRTGVAGVDANRIEPRRDPTDTGAVGPVRPFRIADLEDRDVYSARGQKIGEVKRVVRRIGDNRGYIVLENGGFLGLGEKEVPLPLNRVFLMGDRLVAAGLTEQEVEAIPDWDMNNREYRDLADNDSIEVGVRE